MVLVTQGVHPDVIEGLTVRQSQVLWQAWVDGIYGDFATARAAHVNYSMLHNLTETLIAVNSSKKKKAKKPDGFDKLFPELWAFATGEESKPKGITAALAWERMGMEGELPGG